MRANCWRKHTSTTLTARSSTTTSRRRFRFCGVRWTRFRKHRSGFQSVGFSRQLMDYWRFYTLGRFGVRLSEKFGFESQLLVHAWTHWQQLAVGCRMPRSVIFLDLNLVDVELLMKQLGAPLPALFSGTSDADVCIVSCFWGDVNA